MCVPLKIIIIYITFVQQNGENQIVIGIHKTIMTSF